MFYSNEVAIQFFNDSWRYGILKNDCSGNYNTLLDDSMSELMQFTGLHDKNDKEIYEGDIIKNHNKDLFEICWAQYDMDYHGYCCRHIKSNTRHLFISSDFRNCEIIGNIHENEDLLEVAS